ncbi:hypothetical protein [Nostoc sp.]|uniref:hypothetical protein n=1 Tax=Nostoc sp. TaxID=1180 RepID=UPI002FF57BD4
MSTTGCDAPASLTLRYLSVTLLSFPLYETLKREHLNKERCLRRAVTLEDNASLRDAARTSQLASNLLENT